MERGGDGCIGRPIMPGFPSWPPRGGWDLDVGGGPPGAVHVMLDQVGTVEEALRTAEREGVVYCPSRVWRVAVWGVRDRLAATSVAERVIYLSVSLYAVVFTAFAILHHL